MEEFFAQPTPEGHTLQAEYAKGTAAGMKRVLDFPAMQIAQAQEVLDMYKEQRENEQERTTPEARYDDEILDASFGLED